jgi:hypothetical protein
MKHACIGLVAALLVATAGSSPAQSTVSIKFDNGNVTLIAQNAPVRTILAEWARVGGSKILNGDRVGGQPLSIRIENEPERKALAILLRNVSGYVAASRPMPASGVSSRDRIHVLPAPPPVQSTVTSVAQPLRPTPTTPAASPVVRFVPGDQNEDPPDALIMSTGAAAQRPVNQPGLVNAPTVNVPRGATVGGTVPDDAVQPARPGTTPTARPTFPTTTGRPGEINPVPQQPRREEQ